MSGREPWALALPAVIRVAAAGDREAVAALLARMDRDGLYERHFAHGEAPNLALLRRLERIDGRDHVAMIAIGPDATVVGHAEYVACDRSAEFALLVHPAWRDRGIGRALLAGLLTQAKSAGQAELNGMIQATNTRAIQLTRRMGFSLRPGEDRRTVIVWRALRGVPPAAASGAGGQARGAAPDTPCHDPDRIPLHRRPGP